MSRAQYLLQQHGFDAIGETVGTAASNPALLMRVMEARELLEDAGTQIGAVQSQLSDIEQSVEMSLKELSASFAAGKYDQAARLTVEMQYLSKLLHETKEWLSSRLEQNDVGLRES